MSWIGTLYYYAYFEKKIVFSGNRKVELLVKFLPIHSPAPLQGLAVNHDSPSSFMALYC